MRYPDDATPLIVVGRPRAGTRFVAGALNQFREIAIQGELPIPVMEGLVRFIEDTDKYYERAAEKGEGRHEEMRRLWLSKKEQLFFSLWTNAGQSRVIKPRADCRYFGYKRPNHEMYFDFYERHLHGRKPLYIYCIRNFVDNYLSISARWPERDIARVADEYLASIEQYRVMKKTAPDRVFKFVLDEHVTRGIEHLDKNVLSHLDLVRRPRVMAALESMGPKNTTTGMNVERRTQLTPREERFIAKRPRLRAEFESLLE